MSEYDQCVELPVGELGGNFVELVFLPPGEITPHTGHVSLTLAVRRVLAGICSVGVRVGYLSIILIKDNDQGLGLVALQLYININCSNHS